jgi:hypothetical protein
MRSNFWRDIRILAQIESKRTIQDATYWLELIGFERDSSRVYLAYVMAFWAMWLFIMWAFLVEQVYQASRQIPDAITDNMNIALITAIMIFALQMIYVLRSYFDLPLKLTAPDLAYVAASPVSRAALTLVHFLRKLLLPALLQSIAGTLLAMGLAWLVGDVHVGWAGLQALLVTFALVYISGAAGWIAGISSQHLTSRTRRITVSIITVLLIMGSLLLPDVILLPGLLWSRTFTGLFSILDAGLLLILVSLTVAGLFLAGEHLHITRLIDTSQVYARIQKFGVFGRVMAADLIARIRQQSRLAGRPNIQPRLPLTGNSLVTLVGYSSVWLVRLFPGEILRLLATGSFFPALVIGVIVFGGYQTLQTWLFLGLLLAQIRPDTLTRPFRELIRQSFTWQMVQMNLLTVFISQISLPLLVMLPAIALTVALQPAMPFMPVFLMALSSFIILALCQALEAVRLPATLPNLNYEYLVLIALVLIVLPGVLVQSLIIALLITCLLNCLLAFLLAHSRL